MCIVSNVGDDWRQKKYPDWVPETIPPYKPAPQIDFDKLFKKPVTRDEFEALKKEMEELRELLIKAREIDVALGNADCEMEDKVALIKQLAKLVGVDMSAVFK